MRPRVAKLGGPLVAFVGGLAFAAATPPLDITAGILVGLVVLGRALLEGADVRLGARCGFFFGLAANLIALRFVPEVVPRFTPLPAVAGWAALILLAAAQALPWMIAGALTRTLARHVPGWLAYGSAVYVATFVPAIFPWTPAGGLAEWPVLLQTADVVGERGVSLVIAIACGLGAEALLAAGRAARVLRATLAIGIASVLAGYGMLRMRMIDAARAAAPQASIALVQPDFDASFRWQDQRATMMMDRLTASTRHAEAAGAALTVWPESAYPYTLPHGTTQAPSGERAVLHAGVHGPVLTGAYLGKGGGLGTNSAILVHDDGVIDPAYDKRHLLWFGETVPLADTFPLLRRIFARGGGLEAGTSSVAFQTGAIRFAVLNCYEDTLPVAGREAMEVAPNVLVNITNDAWFVGSAEGELHLRLAALRSIETRRDLLRAVNRGPTSWVDAAGRIRARRPGDSGGIVPPLIVPAALLEGRTLYARFGDAGLFVLLGLGLATAVRLKARGRRSRRTAPAKS